MLAVVVGVWTVAVTTALALVGWAIGEASAELELFPAAPFAPISAVVAGILVMTPAAALAALARGRPRVNPGALAAGRAWLLAGAGGVALGCVRATPQPHNELLLILTAAVAGFAGFLVRRLPGPVEAPDAAASGGADGLAVAVGLAILLPWLAIGALGDPVETGCAVLAAAAVGYLLAGILTPAFGAAFGRSRRWRVVVGGLAGLVALAPVAAALGGQGVNLAELVTVSLLGLAAAALAPRPRALAAMIALAVLGPLALVDPEETTAVLGPGDVGTWAARAALISGAIALALGVSAAFVGRPGRRVVSGREEPSVSEAPQLGRGPWRGAVVAVVVLAGCALAYIGPGRPGFYGDRLFVVMAEQADLRGLDAIADRTERLRATYRRLVDTAEHSQASLRADLDRYGIGYTPYYLVNGLLVDAGPALRPLLSGRSDVDRVLLDERLRPLPGPAADQVGPAAAPDARDPVQWNVKAVQARRGVAERGHRPGHHHRVLRHRRRRYPSGPGRRLPWWPGLLVRPVERLDDADRPHWTRDAHDRDRDRSRRHRCRSGSPVDGVRQPRSGYGSPSHYLDCLQFMLAPFPAGGDPWRDGDPARAPDILTNSWGCPPVEGCDLEALRPATAALAAAGIYVVVAAGNTGPLGCGSVTDPPANYPDVLTVGAVDQRGQVAGFSSRGPTPGRVAKPDLVAPGVDVLSALPHNSYGYYQGTSMATPAVAGVVALMWSANPRLIGRIAQTTAILRATARPSPTYQTVCGAGNAAGAGLVDAWAAVQSARAA